MLCVILVYIGIVCVYSFFFLLWLNHPVSETWSLHSQKEMFNLHPPTQIQILTAQYICKFSSKHSLSNISGTVFFGRQRHSTLEGKEKRWSVIENGSRAALGVLMSTQPSTTTEPTTERRKDQALTGFTVTPLLAVNIFPNEEVH